MLLDVSTYGIALQTDGEFGANLPQWLQEPLAAFVTALPRLIGAIIILLVGWFLGRLVASFVSKLADKIELDRMVLDTPIGKMLGGTQKAVSNAFGTLAAWFVYGIAILAAANVLAIPLLSQWISRALSYLPAFLAGLLIIVLGFVVADFIGDAIQRTRSATQTPYTSWFATGVRMFLYFTAIVVGLDTMGVDVQILYVVTRAVAWGLAVGVALAIGIAFGWGGKDYVSHNIDRWMGRAKQEAPKPKQKQKASPSGDDD